ncbi:hypothetical protein Ancab_016352 [Ancistrocladus abbreviatus]
MAKSDIIDTHLHVTPTSYGSTIITNKKLKDNYYSTRAAVVELCFMGQGYKEHLTKKSLVAIRKFDMPMTAYLGRIQSVLAEFKKLLPLAATQEEQLSQRGTFFMLLAPFGLPPEYGMSGSRRGHRGGHG